MDFVEKIGLTLMLAGIYGITISGFYEMKNEIKDLKIQIENLQEQKPVTTLEEARQLHPDWFEPLLNK